jgi:hypothetical protein
MGREHTAYLSYGYYFTGLGFQELFGVRVGTDWQYVIPGIGRREFDCISDAVNEICQLIGRQTGLKVSYGEEGNHYSDSEQDFGYVIGPDIGASSEAFTLEELLAADAAADEIRRRLTELGFVITGPAHVYSMLHVG